MRKTILVPTDLTIESLNLLSYAIKHHEAEAMDVILLHGYRASDSIVELLFFQRENRREQIIPPNFKNAFEILKNRNETKVKSIRVELFSGINRAALVNFLEANAVAAVYLPKEYKLQNPTPRSFDPTPLLRGVQISTTEVSWQSPAHLPEKNLPAELFLYESK